MPECNVHLAEAVMYVTLAPKSNSVFTAYERAKKDAETYDSAPIPTAVRAAFTNLQKELGYGEGYIYPHDTKEKITTMQCMPDELEGKIYYNPTTQGREKIIKERYEWIENWKKVHREMEKNK